MNNWKGLRTLALFAACAFSNLNWASQLVDLDLRVTRIYIVRQPVEILGEIRGEEIGIESRSGPVYGVPGGGIASVFGMLAGHAIQVQTRQSAQLEKLIGDAKEFGKPFTYSYKGISLSNLIESAYSEMADDLRMKVEFIQIERKEINSAEIVLDVNINISKDYRTLIVESRYMSSGVEKIKIRNSHTSNEAYYDKDDDSIRQSEFTTIIHNLLRESLRIFLKRDELKHKQSIDQLTIKSNIGGKNRFERGFPIESVCGRNLYINLVGEWVVSTAPENNNERSTCKEFTIAN